MTRFHEKENENKTKRQDRTEYVRPWRFFARRSGRPADNSYENRLKNWNSFSPQGSVKYRAKRTEGL